MSELTDGDLLLEEYKILRDEILENLRTRSWILLYLVIIISTVIAFSLTSGNIYATCVIMPLIFPLLIWWNSLYLANLVINNYITNTICRKLKLLRWEIISARQRAVHVGPLLKLHTAPGIAVIYVILALSPSIYIIMVEQKLEFILLFGLNFFLGTIILYITFFPHSILKPVINEVKRYYI